ncbi:MAG: carboxylesterase family protein, partial [Myxococcales bacterium]|nr:carboxylesterase family protein [Myxococcales bacterium]
MRRPHSVRSVPNQRTPLGPPGEQSEDCLTLNVFAPAAGPDDALPVMVFIHGGGFVIGGSSQYEDAHTLSRVGDLVVVTINYRLGALGFLAHPELDAALGRPSGNNGLRDQQLALRWVRDHIVAFGGDPQNVTLFGHSAGAASVCYHLFADGSAGLAQRYITQSGSCLYGGLDAVGDEFASSRELALQLGVDLVTELCGAGADAADCLASAELEDLLAFPGGWSIHVDGPGGLLEDTPRALLAAGATHPGELIVGTNRDEWGLFFAAGVETGGADAASLSDHIDTTYGPLGVEVKALYVAESDEEAPKAFGSLMSDINFHCPSRALAYGFSERGHDTYLYYFDQPPAYHAFELDYVFGTKVLSSAFRAPKNEALGKIMQDYWARFAATGDPNGGEDPHWPVYTADSELHLTLG